MTLARKPYLRTQGAMTWAEIGARLGTTSDAAQKVYQRALRKLRKPDSLARLRALAGSGWFQ